MQTGKIPIKKTHKILIVDDHKDNLFILSRVLDDEAYVKFYAEDGITALEVANKELPDLILLDIMLPQLDGYSVCKKLKKNPETRDIPVIFITVKVNEEDVLKGFDFGGVDYITKPFKYEELLRRVDTHLQLKDSKEVIANQNQALQDFIFNRDSLMSSSVNILKNPIQIITGYAKIIQKGIENMKIDDIKEMMEEIEDSGKTMLGFIENASLMNEIENGRLNYIRSQFNVENIINEIVEKYKVLIERKETKLQIIFEEDLSYIYSDYEKVKIILENLISNALIFTNRNGNVKIVTMKLEANNKAFLCITISDDGPGFTKEDKGKIFQKYIELSNPSIDHDESGRLGLAISRELAILIEGKITFESTQGVGSAFTLRLPIS